MLHLGPDTFDEISGEVVQSTAFVLRNNLPQGSTGTYFRLIGEKNSTDKKNSFKSREKQHKKVNQKSFKRVPGSPIAYWFTENEVSLYSENGSISQTSYPKKGIDTGSNSRFLRVWYEVNRKSIGIEWITYHKGGSVRKWYGNKKFVVNWSEEGKEIKNHEKSTVRNLSYQDKEGYSWTKVTTAQFSCRYKGHSEMFDDSGCSVFSENHLAVIAGLLNSVVAGRYFEALSPTMNYQPGDVASIPHWPMNSDISDIEKIVGHCTSLSRREWEFRETSTGFNQHPLIEQNAASIEVAYEVWTEQTTDNFFQLHANEEELNDLFIDLYGLENVLNPRVALDDITILEDELDRDALADLDDQRDELSDEELRERLPFKPEVPIRQFLSYGIGVMLGRYRLGHDGLHIAHPNPSADELAPYDVPTPLAAENPSGNSTFEIDDDAIVPLMGQDSPFSDDVVSRMREILRLVWGDDTLTENLNFINRALSIGRSRGLKRDYEKTMEEWLVGDFWNWHKSLYSVPYYGKKPIYWLFQSPEGHFQSLVYMHRMNRYTVQQVRQQYLHKYQQYLRNEIQSLEDQGEDSLSSTESKRLETLRQKADDCREYDEILKEVADQQIEIDLDDGVQENYPKFGDAVADL